MEEIEQIYEGFLGAVELAAHRHPLFPTNISSKCIVCSKERLENTNGFSCNQCELYFHKDCIEITMPSHHRHHLKLHYGNISYSKRDICCLCEEKLLDMFYYCSRCRFDLCMSCVKMPLVIDRPRAHEHPLYLINCHDHQISHVDILSPGTWNCGVCHSRIRNQYGAYSCSVCTYAVHSKCAIRDDVWDGIELDGLPEEDGGNKVEDIAPFKVVDYKVIKHFSHEHCLKYFDQDILIRNENQRCYACILPFYYDACYICTHCDFILHETCANLPRIKRHELHKNHFILYPNTELGEELELRKSFFTCVACKRPSSGFRYESGNVKLDVRCATISDEFRHEAHPHSLFILSLFLRICSACDQEVYGLLSCAECYFSLCFKCATLPNEVFYKHDNHPLFLRHYGNQCRSSTSGNGLRV